MYYKFYCTYIIRVLNDSIYVNDLIKSCLDTEDITKKFELLYAINSLITLALQIALPSLFTNSYIDQALYSLEERLSKTPLSLRGDSFPNS